MRSSIQYINSSCNISVNNVGMSYDFPEFYAELPDDQVMESYL